MIKKIAPDFSGDDISNAIPESASLSRTIRAFSDKTRSIVIQRLREVAAGLEDIYRVTCGLDIKKGVPGCRNDEGGPPSLLFETADILDEENICSLTPTAGAEDFAYFSMARPSAIMRLGCANASKRITFPLHSPHFNIDESVLEIGVPIFLKAIYKFFQISFLRRVVKGAF